MDETGCGKTCLLKILSIFMNKGYEKMKTLNVHAGTNEEDITNFMRKIINNIQKEKDEELKKIMDRFDSQDENYKKAYKEDIWRRTKTTIKWKKLWLFFEELNTCNSMGLIYEIMCKRIMLRKPLPEELVFLSDVNLYRTMTSKMKHNGLTFDSYEKTL